MDAVYGFAEVLHHHWRPHFSLFFVSQLATAYGMDFFETSAFTNHNITEVRSSEADLYKHAQMTNMIKGMHALLVT